MKKISILSCVFESIKYLFDNIRSISLLALQIYGVTIISTLLLSKITGVNLFNSYSDLSNVDSPILLVCATLFMGLLASILGISFKLSLSRHIALKEPFNTSLLRLIQQKRYWYCFLATLKMWAAIILVCLLVLVVFLLLLLILFGIFLLLLTLMQVDAISSLSEFLNSFSSMLIISLTGLIYLICVVIFLFITAIFIYTPLLAAIDQKGSLRDSWKLSKGNLLKIAMILLVTYIIPTIPYTLLTFLISYLATGSILMQPLCFSLFSGLIGLYVSIPLTASIAFSYRSITTPQAEEKP